MCLRSSVSSGSGEVLRVVGFKGRLRPKGVAPFSKLAVYLRVGKNRYFSIWKGRKICCKVKEVAAKAKQGCQILAKIATRNTKKLGTFEQLSEKG